MVVTDSILHLKFYTVCPFSKHVDCGGKKGKERKRGEKRGFLGGFKNCSFGQIFTKLQWLQGHSRIFFACGGPGQPWWPDAGCYAHFTLVEKLGESLGGFRLFRDRGFYRLLAFLDLPSEPKPVTHIISTKREAWKGVSGKATAHWCLGERT